MPCAGQLEENTGDQHDFIPILLRRMLQGGDLMTRDMRMDANRRTCSFLRKTVKREERI
jgi:hypothetical protein